MSARPRPVEAPRPLGEVDQAYLERALLACLLSDPRGTIAAIKETRLLRSDVSVAMAEVIASARDILGAGELVSVEALAATLKARRAEAPRDAPGWYSYLTGCGLSDHDPGRWCRALRAMALRRRLPAAAQAVAERRAGALQMLSSMVAELQALAGGTP